MKKNKMVLTALVLASLSVMTANAQYLNTFDTPSSLSATRNFNPPPVWVGFDYGTATAASTASAGWSSQDAAGSPSSGSVQLGWTWNTTADGAGSAAFTMDLFSSAQNYSGGTLSFDIMLGAGSTPGAFNDYGYFQVFTRDGSYNENATSLGEGLITAAGGAVGQWAQVSIPLGIGADSSIRALTFQDYTGGAGDRNINGPETIYIDNVQLTPAPEPSTMALAGLAMSGLFGLRRFRKN